MLVWLRSVLHLAASSPVTSAECMGHKLIRVHISLARIRLQRHFGLVACNSHDVTTRDPGHIKNMHCCGSQGMVGVVP